MTAVILLCGCSAARSPEKLADCVREQYADCAEIRAAVEIRADSGAEYTDFTVEIAYENGDPPHASITVCRPESIAGVTAER